MVGGPGQTRKITKEFLRSDFYVIPCGAVPKGSDPHGRIIHDYSFSYEGEESLNSALLENSVQYISFLKRAEVLSRIKWNVDLDLTNGTDSSQFTPQNIEHKFTLWVIQSTTSICVCLSEKQIPQRFFVFEFKTSVLPSSNNLEKQLSRNSNQSLMLMTFSAEQTQKNRLES